MCIHNVGYINHQCINLLALLMHLYKINKMFLVFYTMNILYTEIFIEKIVEERDNVNLVQ